MIEEGKQAMHWIDSTGGPLICAELDVASQWMGLEGTSDRIVEGNGHDYSRACSSALHGYIESLTVGSGVALVLGDEPLRSSFHYHSNQLFIVRWVFSAIPDVRGVLADIAHKGVELATTIEFTINAGELALFDASFSGDDALKCCATAKVNPGFYNVTSVGAESNVDDIKFIVHKFCPSK